MVGWLTSIKATGDYRNIKNSSYLTFPELKSINTMSMFGENLISISLPNCSYIGSYAFAYCTSLTSISIPNCSYIEDYAFTGCTSLTSISIPNCSYIGDCAFVVCSLSSISIPNCSYIGNAAFSNCYNLSYIHAPNCSYIGNSTFYNCENLISISLPNCSYIGSSAFQYCDNLTNSCVQDILNTYKSYSTAINTGVFYGCNGITSLDLTGYTSIGDSVFYRCSSLTSISIPNCSYIGSWAFYSCTNLSYISPMPNCSYIGSYAFYSCAKLTNSNIQDILNTYKSYSDVINNCVFAYCSGITSLDLTGYTSIGNSAFAGCTLSYISVPNCSYIGSNVFYGCTKLESIYILSTSIPILSNYNAFTNTPISNYTYLGYFGSIYVLSSLVNLFKTATNWSRYSSRITAYTP